MYSTPTAQAGTGSGIFAKRTFRRGELRDEGEAVLSSSKPGTVHMRAAATGDLYNFDVVTHCALDHALDRRLFYAGIDGATDAIMAALTGQFEAPTRGPAASGGDGEIGSVLCCLLLVFIVLVVLSNSPS